MAQITSSTPTAMPMTVTVKTVPETLVPPAAMVCGPHRPPFIVEDENTCTVPSSARFTGTVRLDERFVMVY